MQTNLSSEDIAGLNRDFADIEALSECEGTKIMVAERIGQMKNQLGLLNKKKKQ